MNLKIKSESDFVSGMFFSLVGVAAIIIARRYPMGTGVAMGPGYFPTAIGMILIVVGLLIFATSFRVTTDKIDRSINLRAILSVCVGLLLFGWGIERIGFVPSLFGLLFLSTLGGNKINWVESIVLSAGVVFGAWLVFVVMLDLPVQLFW